MIRLYAKVLLFDLDGTLIYSIPAVERAWRTFARRHSLDETTIFEKIHGRRSIDSIRRLLPDVDPETEDLFIRQLEASDTDGVVTVPGARELLESLDPSRWAIVTSGTSDVALARWQAVKLPKPGAFVFGEDVRHGKPAPDPFLLGASKLGAEPSECVGFEDTAAGLASIASAGMIGVGVGCPAQYRIENYRGVVFSAEGGRLGIDLPIYD